MVRVHGGGNRYGHGGQEIHHGRSLARRGLVVVTLNHRLGAPVAGRRRSPPYGTGVHRREPVRLPGVALGADPGAGRAHLAVPLHSDPSPAPPASRWPRPGTAWPATASTTSPNCPTPWTR
ncbi:carboxylesterase family protein [Streptomyces sp. Ag109_O5-1]|uniref:carboxylesterase family protein n=1 Tax=Streptomyces sp. Ag109_O5-1 TaxID=1938851 RepID=UPI000F512B84|nr:carboxylesterase family protein [Streptomyces sp. Ag109_O5-1]